MEDFPDEKDLFDHVEIHLDGQGHGVVKINGQPLKSTIGATIVKTHAGMPAEVVIRMYAVVDAILETKVTIKELPQNE